MQRITKLALVAALVAAPLAASAKGTYGTAFNTKYGTAGTVLDDCNTCHGAGGTSTFNPYGLELQANIGSGITAALDVADPKDSDGDGYANGVEARALTFPGDASSFPTTTAPAPKIAVSPLQLAFGTVTVGSQGQQPTTVSNTGDADLTVTVSACSGTSAEFTASPASFTVAPKGSATVTVTYAPVDATTDQGCLTLAHNDKSTTAISVSLSGTGQAQAAPVFDVDITRFSFPKRLDISRGGVAAPKVTVVNAGNSAGTATVTVEGSYVDAQGTTVPVYSASTTVTLAPGATAKVPFGPWTPTAPAIVTWTATVADGDPDADLATGTTKVVP